LANLAPAQATDAEWNSIKIVDRDDG
jgi:hypothetical protein